MNRNMTVSLVLLVACLPMAAHVDAQNPRAEPPLDLGKVMVPTGSLGKPLGTLIKIEGVQISEGLAHGTSTLRVDLVNGKKLAKKVDIWIEDVGSLPEGKRCVLEGYENMRMSGIPPAVEDFEKRKGVQKPGVQGAWRAHLFFVPLEVIAPKELEISKSKTKDR